jgi:hypothetical protein
MLLRLLDDRRQVSPSTIFHKDVQHACVAVNVAVMILHYMRVIEILQDVASGVSGQFSLATAQKSRRTPLRQLACDRVRSCVRNQSLSELRSMMRSRGCKHFDQKKKLTTPSCFLLTFRMIPKDPLPMTSSGS